MIDIALIREVEKRGSVEESERGRFHDEKNVEAVYELDKKRLHLRHLLDEERMHINKIQDAMPGLSAEERETNSRKLKVHKENSCKIARSVEEVEREIEKRMGEIGNLLDENVVISQNEEDNALIHRFESPRPAPSPCLEYDEVLKRVGGVDAERGVKIFGHRGYFLKGEIAMLKNALVSYAIDFAAKKGFKLIQTPVIMKRDVIAKTCQLSDFDDQLYGVDSGLCLIATAEHPISTMYSDERIPPKSLPIKYAGQSLCFRREAGAHGKDNKGIFRVHQFEKVEQFVICSPEDSKGVFNEMVENAMEFYRSLGLSFRVVSIVSGELNNAAAIKYDLEALFPASNRFRELVSISNCTDYQSRNANIRMDYNKRDGKKFVHMLNGTLCAAERTLCCIAENYQSEDGLMIPDPLKCYVGREIIYYDV